MTHHPLQELADADDGTPVVVSGNVAFALGCLRGGIHAADGYPGAPCAGVIDEELRHVGDRMAAGSSVNEANAVAVGFGVTMAGADAVVALTIPGLFQAADVVATAASRVSPRGGLVLFVASDFVASSAGYLTDPRYFLKSCFIPVLEPRSHQELAEIGPLAADLSRQAHAPVAILSSGLLCRSEGLVHLPTRRHVPVSSRLDDLRSPVALPQHARSDYDTIVRERVPGVQRWSEALELNRAARGSGRLGVIVHGATELSLREVWDSLPVKPSVLSLATTFPLPMELVERFCADVDGPIVVLGDGHRFVEEELRSRGLDVEGKGALDPTTEWSPSTVARRIALAIVPTRLSSLPAASPHDPLYDEAAGRGARSSDPGRARGGTSPPERPSEPGSRSSDRDAIIPAPELPQAREPVGRPPGMCARCPYRAFGLVVAELRAEGRIVASLGDIGCDTLLYHLGAIDTCSGMGASEAERQGLVLASPGLGSKVISVVADSAELHTGLTATRNAVIRKSAGVKVVLGDGTNAVTASRPQSVLGGRHEDEAPAFDLVAALRGEGAYVEVVDGFDIDALREALGGALDRAGRGGFTAIVVRGTCHRWRLRSDRPPRYAVHRERCEPCNLCYVCAGSERSEQGEQGFTHLCNGCSGSNPSCAEPSTPSVCKLPPAEESKGAPERWPEIAAESGERMAILPVAIRVAVRGVGGQGASWIGEVLGELALLAGFDHIVKGAAHNAVPIGGAAIATFGCGDVHSPVPAPGTVDVLVALERGEVLRAGFLDLLRPGGVVVLDALRLVPPGSTLADYPTDAAIRAALGNRRIVEMDARAEARALGDERGRTSPAVVLGVLSTIGPLADVPAALWHRALGRASCDAGAHGTHVAAFRRGRAAAERRSPSSPSPRRG